MQKFIDVQKLADYLTEEAKNYLEDNSVQCTIAAGVVCSVKKDILRMPTANVVEAGKIEQIKSEAVKEFANEFCKKFAGHSDYHGDTILTKIVCMVEGQKVDVAKSLDISKIQAEAVKEFAERLKKPNRWREEDIYYIDTLVEEMVGEEK